MGVSFTAAWYIRTKTSSIDIILSDPVNVNVTINDDITNEFKYDFIVDTGNSRVYPGDRIKLKLGVITINLDKVKEYYTEEYAKFIIGLAIDYKKELKQMFKETFA